MHLSIFSNVIQGNSPAEVARKTRDYGLESVQFTPPSVEVGFGFDPDQAVEASFEEWARAYAAENVGICGVAGYINLLHHDPDHRRHNIDTFKRWMRGMKELGTTFISTETGSYATTGDWDDDPQNRTPAAWDDLRRVTDELLTVAAQENVTLLYEPYIVNVAYTPDLAVKLLDEVNSPHLALMMDPTNWFNNEDATPERVDDVIQHGFAVERGRFKLAHVKDVTPPEPGSPKPGLPGPGQGILNYRLYIDLLREHGYDGPLIIEHLTEAEVPAAVAYVRSFL